MDAAGAEPSAAPFGAAEVTRGLREEKEGEGSR